MAQNSQSVSRTLAKSANQEKVFNGDIKYQFFSQWFHYNIREVTECIRPFPTLSYLALCWKFEFDVLTQLTKLL